MSLYRNWCLKKAQIKLERLLKFYHQEDSVLDVGSGNCALSILLKNNHIQTTSLDIKSRSAFKEEIPIIYDGKRLPFKDKEFDVVQLITVLHHIKDPESILAEAYRVGKKVIVMEDIYDNPFQKWLTFIADSINNWEFLGHPHSNKTDEQWKDLFKNKNMTLLDSEYYRFLLFFKQVTYVLS